MRNGLDDFYRELDGRYTQGDLQQVEQFLQEQAQGQPERVSELIAVYNEMGSFYRGTSHYTQSLDAFEKAKALASESVGQQCSQYATILNNMAGTYRLTREYDKAIELFLEAIAIYRLVGEEESYAFASVLNNLSLVYRETKNIDKAIHYLEQALHLIEQMPGHRQEVAITYNNLTVLHRAAGHKEQATACIQRAIEEFEQCAEDENVHYAAGLNSLAGILYAEKDYMAALELYHKSAKYTKKFFGENAEYAVTHQNMYWVYKEMGDWKHAIESLEEAERVFECLLGAEHERTRAVADDLARLRKVSNA